MEGEKKDWRFDIGLRNGHFAVEAWCSDLEAKLMRKVTRLELLELRNAINNALKRYPVPQ